MTEMNELNKMTILIFVANMYVNPLYSLYSSIAHLFKVFLQSSMQILYV